MFYCLSIPVTASECAWSDSCTAHTDCRSDNIVYQAISSLKFRSRLVCNPYAEPGYPDWHHGSETARCVNFGWCPPSPDSFANIIEQSNSISYPQCNDYLRNKTVLLLGDSIDRNGLEQAGEILHVKTWSSDYRNASFVELPEGWHPNAIPYNMYLEELDYTLVNGFFYGMVSHLR